MKTRRLFVLAGIPFAIALGGGCASYPSSGSARAQDASPAVRAEMQRLKSRDPRVRVAAVQALCEMRDDDTAAWVLVARMNDGESYVDGADPNGHVLHTSPGSVAQSCLDEFGSVATPALLSAMKRGNANQRANALFILSMTGDPRGIQPTIDAMLHDRSAHVRHTAVERLRSDDPQPFVKALKDPVTGERAAWALRFIKDPTTIDPLIDALQHSKVWSIRNNAADALGDFGGARAVEPLLAATRDPEGFVRLTAVSALGRTRDPRVFEPLIAMLNGDDIPVAFNAAAALGVLKDRRAVEPLIRVLERYDPPQSGLPVNYRRTLLRETAATALGAIGDFRATPALVGALHDPEINLPGIAALALAELGDPTAIEPLIGAMDAAVSLSRARMAEALGKLNASQAVEPLIALLNDRDVTTRMSAAEALGKLKDPRAVEPLTHLLDDRLPYVGMKAAEALRAITGNDYSDRVRRAPDPSP
jgi:HEAT repeat protein